MNLSKLSALISVTLLVAIFLGSGLNTFLPFSDFASANSIPSATPHAQVLTNATPSQQWLPIILLNAPNILYWSLNGNGGTDASLNFIGTTDNVTLTSRVNNIIAFRLAPTAPSGTWELVAPNVIGGLAMNAVTDGVFGATIGGGGDRNASADHPNRVTDHYGTIGGGANNQAGDNDATVTNAAYAIVGGGHSNKASGTVATVGGGYSNTASGFAATVPGGNAGNASHYGQMANASGLFTSAGDAQTSVYVLRNTTAGIITTEELFLDGSSARLTIAPNRTLTFDVLVVGRRDSNNQSAGYHFRGVIKNDGGTTALVGSVVKEVLGEDVAGWDANVTADDGNDALRIEATGAGLSTIRWVATVRTVEVAW